MNLLTPAGIRFKHPAVQSESRSYYFGCGPDRHLLNHRAECLDLFIRFFNSSGDRDSSSFLISFSTLSLCPNFIEGTHNRYLKRFGLKDDALFIFTDHFENKTFTIVKDSSQALSKLWIFLQRINNTCIFYFGCENISDFVFFENSK